MVCHHTLLGSLPVTVVLRETEEGFFVKQKNLRKGRREWQKRNVQKIKKQSRKTMNVVTKLGLPLGLGSPQGLRSTAGSSRIGNFVPLVLPQGGFTGLVKHSEGITSNYSGNVGFPQGLRGSSAGSSRSWRKNSFVSPQGLVQYSGRVATSSGSPFPLWSRASRSYQLGKFGVSENSIPQVWLAAVSTKQEDSVKTVERGGGGDIGGPNDGGGGGGGGGGDAVDWISSAVIFAFWAGLLFYGITMAPNQTSYRDTYFIEKLCGFRGDDGFLMNKVLTGEWLMMGCWPLVYTCLLIPSGRSRKGVPVGPFAALSVALGAFALLPYFGLWRPPPAPVARDDLSRWPLCVLESKITAVVTIVSAVLLLGYVGLAGAEQWAEFSQYFRESKFIHIMTIDFITLSTLCPFWVYNDLAVRKGSDDTSPLWALAFLPLVGPSVYLLLRPSLPACMIVETDKENDGLAT